MFNEEQKIVIRTWNTVNIQACPGSGKTTTLAAKLMILAEKLPKSFQQGICIITHTNTAVDEIKKKLGPYANFYNNYPHHFGTIQSFVDKYLAIPAYKKHFQQSPNILDDDTWLKYLEKQSDYVRLAKNNYITTNSINISKLVFNLNNFKISKKLNDTNVFVGENSDTYKNIYAFKKRMLEQGQVSYAEAYSLAFSYLRKNPQLANLFSKRFSLVLIDEMQDMETHQYKLINDLFGNGNTIVQKIGDINQSIFSLNSEQEKSDWDTSANSLSLNSTTRLSHHLAEIVKPICLSPQSMEGNWNPFPLIKPTIIVFNDNTKGNVKEKFVELIHAHNLLQFWSEDKPFKVIGGRRGEVQDKHLNINSYWSDFNKNISVKTREEFDNLFAYLEKCQALKSEKNVKEIRKTLLNAICKALKLAEIRNPLTSYYFTPATFTQYLFSEKEVENKNLNAKLAKWILGFQHTPELRTEIEDYLKTLLTIFQKQSTTKLENFLADTAASIEPQQEPRQSYEYQGVKVFFDTVHGVKGETHTATLYLETYLKQVFDIGGKILPHITNPVKPDKACKKRLPQAYVAMSRATHFLCLAVHKDRFKDDVKAYFENSDNGWEVDCSLV
ncbi:UvrD-helicase domain-containing protein [Emticicia sp. ODNR4P]|nr:UvrD-helicase domain-containing protein [Emticicia sp. ODNR4P]